MPRVASCAWMAGTVQPRSTKQRCGRCTLFRRRIGSRRWMGGTCTGSERTAAVIATLWLVYPHRLRVQTGRLPNVHSFNPLVRLIRLEGSALFLLCTSRCSTTQIHGAILLFSLLWTRIGGHRATVPKQTSLTWSPVMQAERSRHRAVARSPVFRPAEDCDQ
jgi:hypothetical protein